MQTTKTKRKNRRKRWILAAIGVGLVGLSLFAVFNRREAAITIQTEKATRRDLTETVVANGKIQPVIQVVISPEVPGEIVELPVRDGQKVTKGELLLRIKSDNYVASRNSAEASYMSALANQNLAMANLEKAQIEYKRIQRLFESKLVSDSEFLTVKTTLDVQKASHETSTHQVAQAKAALDRARDELLKTTIVAPMDGTVTKLKSEVGERVVGSAMMPGTEIMTIANLEEMEAVVDIGEMDIVLIANEQKAMLEVDAFRDRKFVGRVTEIANAAKTMGAGSQQESTKFEVKILIDEREVFRPGMSVTAKIETRYRTNVLTVPIQCVTSRILNKDKDKGDPKRTGTAAGAQASNGRENETAETRSGAKRDKEAAKPVEVVFVVEGDRVEAAPVERGVSDDEHVEILSGLKEGDQVVSGSYNAIMRELEDGKMIRVDNAAPAKADNKKTP